MTSPPAVPLVDAATVVVVRRGPAGAEVLLVERPGKLAFHGGHWVFPGGKVEAADVADDEVATARNAAVRETAEEVGVALDPAGLVPFAHWTTPDGAPRVFRTWFFLAEVAADVPVVPDPTEVADARWLTADAALAAHRAGDLVLPVPQFTTLLRLASPGWLDERLTGQDGPIEHFHGRRTDVEGGICWRYDGDEAWDHGDLGRPGPRRRFWATTRDAWRFEES